MTDGAWRTMCSYPARPSIVSAGAAPSRPQSLRLNGGLRLLVFWGMAALLCAGASVAWAAHEPEKTNEKIVQKELTGQVVWIGKHAISVEYDRDATSSYEMLLPVTGDLELERLKNLSELKRGDTIHVDYRQTVKQGEDGQEMVVKTVATKVALMRQASPEGTLRSKNETTLE